MGDLSSAPLPLPGPGDHVRGPDRAPLVIVYGDYECPFCAALAQHQRGSGRADLLRFTPVPAARDLAARALEALRTEGDVRMGSRRWRLQRSRPSRASKMRFAPGSSAGDGAS